MALSELGGKCESRTNVGFFEIRKILEQLLHRAAGGHRLNHHPHSHTHTPDAWLPAHHFGIDRNALDSLHIHIVARTVPCAVCRQRGKIPLTLWARPGQRRLR